MSSIRSRRAGMSVDEARQRPFYARALGLQYLRPSSLVCFAFFEGTIALAVLLALAELASWWAVGVLPASVAVMVKINDIIAGAAARSGSRPTRIRAPEDALGRAPERLHDYGQGDNSERPTEMLPNALRSSVPAEQVRRQSARGRYT